MSAILCGKPLLAEFDFGRLFELDTGLLRQIPRRLLRLCAGNDIDSGPKALRIDVNQQPSELEHELDTLYGRLHRPGDALHNLPAVCIHFPGLVFRYREADGEHYVYAEDTARRCLAGYTVFNRLIEVNRRADPHLRAPHSKYAPAYQRRGIATAIYRWWLENNRCLITGARQSAGANALWHSLGTRYDLIYVNLQEKTLRYLGRQVDEQMHDDLHTRMIMLGKGWDMDRLAECTGMLRPAGGHEQMPAADAQSVEHGDPARWMRRLATGTRRKR